MMPQIIPIRDLKNTSEISQMCHEINEPIFVTKNGYGDMVIMSIQLYEEAMYMLNILGKLEVAEKEVAEGKVLDAKAALASIREKYNV